MLGNYLPILIFMCITLVMGSVFIILGKLLGPSRPDAEKNSPYECGFEAFEDSRMKFDVRYYLVAILGYRPRSDRDFWPGRDGGISRPTHSRLYLRVEERSA